MAAEKADEKTALKKVAKERGMGKSEAYREWQQGQVRAQRGSLVDRVHQSARVSYFQSIFARRG